MSIVKVKIIVLKSFSDSHVLKLFGNLFMHSYNAHPNETVKLIQVPISIQTSYELLIVKCYEIEEIK